jgi:hypothetical protein
VRDGARDVHSFLRYAEYWFERHITDEDKPFADQTTQSADGDPPAASRPLNRAVTLRSCPSLLSFLLPGVRNARSALPLPMPAYRSTYFPENNLLWSATLGNKSSGTGPREWSPHHSFLRSAEHSGKLIAGNNICRHIFIASRLLSFSGHPQMA